MTREEQLLFCSVCKNRILDLKQGLICSLTSEKASFDFECSDFSHDEKVKDRSFDREEEVGFDEAKSIIMEDHIEILRLEQNLKLALIVGSFTGIFCGILWGAITLFTEYYIGYVALGVGAAVGFSIRYVGKGVDKIFGIWGAIIAFISCLIGDVFSLIGFIAKENGLGFFETFLLIDYSLLPEVLYDSFNILSLFFYGIASYWAYKYSYRSFTKGELHNYMIKNRIKTVQSISNL